LQWYVKKYVSNGIVKFLGSPQVTIRLGQKHPTVLLQCGEGPFLPPASFCQGLTQIGTFDVAQQAVMTF